MRTFTSFISLIFLITIPFVSSAQAEEVAVTQKTYTCESSKDEPNLRKVCTDKSVQTYLLENFFQQVGNNPELADVTCDWNLPITPKGFFSQGPNFGVICQNQDSTHRVLIGWDGNKKYMETMQGTGNLQLDFRTKVPLQGRLRCDEALSISKQIKNSIASFSCVMTLVAEKEKEFKLKSSIIFLKPEKADGRRFFVQVMNIVDTTSTEDTEAYLLKLLAK